MTIRNKIILYDILLILLVISLMTVLVNIITSGAIIRNAKNNTQTELTLIESNIDSVVHNLNNYIVSFSIEKDLQAILKQNPVAPTEPADIYNIQNQVLESYTHIRGLNEYIDSYELYTPGFEAFNFSRYSGDEDQPALANDASRPIWTGPSELTNRAARAPEWIFTVYKKVIDLNVGNHIGYVSFFVAEEKLGSIYGNLNKESGVFVINRDSRIISSTDRSSIGIELNEAIQLSSSQLSDLHSSRSGTYEINRSTYLISISNYEKQDWDILYMVPYSEITRGTNMLNITIALIGIGCVLFSFVFSFLISRNISKPIFELANIMKSIQKDRMDTRFPVTSQDEIGILGKGFNSLMDRIDGLLNTVYSEQKQIRDYEFKLIQSQINPHFLYNSLGMIESLINIEEYDEAVTHVHYLTNFYRLSLSTGEDFVTLYQEFEITRSYLEIQKRRYIEYISYETSLDKKTENAIVPKLILQPLVENAIYHGLKESKRKGLVRVSSKMKENTVELSVYDSGKGMNSQKQQDLIAGEEKESFGLTSVKRRLELLYGEQYGLRISSEIGVFTEVLVTLPFVG